MFGLFEKRFGLKEAEILHAEINGDNNDNGDSISIKTLKTTLKILGVRNTVAADIAKKNGGLSTEVTGLSEANSEITEYEKTAEAQLLIAIENMKKAREAARQQAADQISDNTANIKDLETEITRTSELSIYG